MRALGFDLQTETALRVLTSDVVQSSAIEGERLDATRRAEEPLSEQRLCGWHAALFPVGYSGTRPIAVGTWRPVEAGSMQVVSRPFGRERVHFEAPAAKRLSGEMARFIAWCNADTDEDPVLRAAVGARATPWPIPADDPSPRGRLGNDFHSHLINLRKRPDFTRTFLVDFQLGHPAGHHVKEEMDTDAYLGFHLATPQIAGEDRRSRQVCP